MRQKKGLGQHRMPIHPQNALRLRIPKDRLRLIHIGEDRQATLIECATIQRHGHMSCCPFEQSRADIGFQSLDRLCGGGAGQPQIGGSRKKTAPFHHPHEKLHAQ
ncbi:hypothetical protein D3C73_437960 [compost metagenome]